MLSVSQEPVACPAILNFKVHIISVCIEDKTHDVSISHFNSPKLVLKKTAVTSL